MIRPRGIALVIVAIIVFVLAGQTRVGWLLLFDAVLWGMIVVSAIMPWLAMGRLHVRRRTVGWDGREDEPGPMEGDAVQFELKLRNDGLLPSMFVTVQLNWGGPGIEPERERLFLAWLGRNCDLSITTKVKFQRRGLKKLSSVRVESSLPFGLFRRSRRVGEPTELVVLPRVYPLSQLELGGSADTVSQWPFQARLGEQTTGSRNFVPGDPWQHIHWRNSARTAQPQIKEFKKTADGSLVIAIDTSLTQHGGTEALEHAVRIAASVGDFVCRSGGTVRLVTERLHLESSNRYHLLKELALLEGTPRSTLAAPRHVFSPSTRLIALVLDTNDEGIESLIQLANGHYGVTAVLLRGFDSSGPARDPSEKLHRTGMSLVECWPGGIPEALTALESDNNQIAEGHVRRDSAPLIY